jgi:hypothetical protein
VERCNGFPLRSSPRANRPVACRSLGLALRTNRQSSYSAPRQFRSGVASLRDARGRCNYTRVYVARCAPMLSPPDRQLTEINAACPWDANTGTTKGAADFCRSAREARGCPDSTAEEGAVSLASCLLGKWGFALREVCNAVRASHTCPANRVITAATMPLASPSWRPYTRTVTNDGENDTN